MPNWIEGTLKLRGDPENIMRFFREGVAPSTIGFGDDENDNPESVVEEEKLRSGSSFFSFKNEPWVKGTRRAFITERWSTYVDADRGQFVAAVSIKQAWNFTAENWKEIAKQFNLDIRLQGFECGCEFAQDLIVAADGTIVHDNEIKYEDWNWDCPMPRMGG